MRIRGTRLEDAVDWAAVRLADPHGPWGRSGPLLAEALWRVTGLWSPSLRDSLGFPRRSR